MKPTFSIGVGKRVRLAEMKFDECTHVRINPSSDRQLQKLRLLERILEAEVNTLAQLQEVRRLVEELTGS